MGLKANKHIKVLKELHAECSPNHTQCCPSNISTLEFARAYSGKVHGVAKAQLCHCFNYEPKAYVSQLISRFWVWSSIWPSVRAFRSKLQHFFCASNPFLFFSPPDNCYGICPQISTNVNNDHTVQKNIEDGSAKSLVPLCLTCL